MSYLDFWWSVIMGALGVVLRNFLPFIIGAAVLIAMVILAVVLL